jgi:hypothetical protein
MRHKTLLAVLALAVAVMISAPTSFAQNMLTNGSFETGDFSGWTTGGNFEFSSVTSGAYYDYSGAQDGTFYAVFGPVSTPGTISQSFDTTAGASYTFSFWLNAVGDDPSHFTAYWNDTPVLDLSDPNTGGVWTMYSFNETGTGHDTITFAMQDDPGYIALDNASVTTNQGSTPEPSSILLLGTGVLALGGTIRRKLGR